MAEMMTMEPSVPIAAGNSRRTWTIPNDVLVKLDAWRGDQRPIPTESQAVAELLLIGIEAWLKEYREEVDRRIKEREERLKPERKS